MNIGRSGGRVAWLALVLAAGLVSPVRGQIVSASVTGSVTDETGAVRGGVAITAVNQKTGVAYEAKTNEAGIYTITGLPIGSYVVKAAADGFKPAATNPIALEIGQIARVNVKLEVGGRTEDVQVIGASPILQTENAVVGEVVTGSTAVALPLNGRNFVQLTLLTPGVVAPKPDSFVTPKNGDDAGRPYVNGQREQGNNFMLDGLDQNEAIDNLVAYYPSPDALAEIRVETNNYSAEFGNVAGAVVNAVMKSGANEIHGNVFEFMRNDAFDANSFTNNAAGAEKSELKQHIYGGTVGGPIVRNKVFFFADYQGTHVDRPGGATAAVAPEAWRRGDLSDLLGSGVQVRDPLTGQPFPNNQIPTSRFSPAARALFADPASYPLPTGAGLTGNLVGEQMSSTRNQQGDVKIDASLSPRDNAFLRISVGDYDSATTQTPFPLQLGSAYKSSNQSVATSWSHQFGTSSINELRIGYSRVTIDDLRNGGGIDWAGVGNYNQKLGISGNQAIAGLSAIQWNSAGIDNIGSAAPTSATNNRIFQLSEKLSFSKGRHFISTGAQLLHYRMGRSYASNSGVLGFFTFSGQFTGHAFSDFLLDQVSSKGIGGANPWEQRQNRVGLYLQDDFKASSNLTLNIGLRWEYTSPLTEIEDRQMTYDLSTGQALFAGEIPAGVCSTYAAGCVKGSSRALYDAYYGGFAPRLGFAWTLNDSTVIRGGYGIVQYMEGTGANNRLTQNPPFVPVDAVRNYTSPAGSMARGFEDTSAGAPPALGVGQLRYVDPSLRPQLTQQWNLFVERKLTGTLSASVGYVGNTADHLATFRDMNQAVPGTGAPETWVDAEQRRRLRDVLPGAGPVRFTGSDSTGNYHGLQASLRKRRAKGLEFLASYTYSKAMTDNQGFYGAGWGSGSYTHFQTGIGDGNQDSYNPQADYGPAAFDVKHNLVVSASYELPIGKDRSIGRDWSGFKQLVLGGWNVNSIVSARSGFPVTVSNGWGNRSLQPNFAYQRPDRIGDGSVSNPTWERWLDPAAFKEAELGTFGDSGVGILRGPGFWNVDLGVDKNIGLGGSRFLMLKVEAFNVFNHTNKGMPNRDWSNKAQFGTITDTANAARVLEFALKFQF